MKHWLTAYCLCLILLFSAGMIIPVYSADVTVGFLTSSNKLGEVEEAAEAWVKDNFNTATLLIDKTGNFKKDGGTALQPERFAVLWMFYTETNALPEPFLADATVKAILDNVLNYLGENSAFFAVEPNGKLATTWGDLKALSK